VPNLARSPISAVNLDPEAPRQPHVLGHLVPQVEQPFRFVDAVDWFHSGNPSRSIGW